MRVTRYGYARVSTRSQTDDSQLDALTAAGCERIWTDTASGKLARRPGWDKCLDYVRAGDELVVTRLSRMARSVRHLTEIAALLAERGVDLVVLKQESTPPPQPAGSCSTSSGRWTRCWPTSSARAPSRDWKPRGRVAEPAGANPSSPPGRSPSPRYDEKDADGKRRYTVAEIAETFHVSRKAIYRHLEPTPTATSSPAG
jgi:hypothetical protein